jgi:hypothetical protein
MLNNFTYDSNYNSYDMMNNNYHNRNFYSLNNNNNNNNNNNYDIYKYKNINKNCKYDNNDCMIYSDLRYY